MDSRDFHRRSKSVPTRRDPNWLEQQLQANNIRYTKNLLTPYSPKRIPIEVKDTFKWVVTAPSRIINGIKRMRYYTAKEWRRFASVAMVWVLLFSMLVNFWPTPAQAQYTNFGASGKGFLMYSDNTTTPQKRQWNFGNSSIGSEASTTTWDDVYQTVVKASHTVQNFWVMGVADNAGNLDVRTSSDGGSTWTSGFTATIGGTGNSRRFDIDIEQLSGDIVVAYSKNATTNEIGIRRYTTSWQSEATYDPAGTSDVVTWIELAAKANSDELALAFLTNQSSTENINAGIWNGSSNTFGNDANIGLLCDQTNASPDGIDKCFDIQYETGSGRPVLIFGIHGGGDTTNTVRSVRWDGSTWTTTTMSLTDDTTQLDCAADPRIGSLEISCMSIGNGSDDSQTWSQTYVGTGGGTGCTGQSVYNCVIDSASDTSVHTDAAGRLLVAMTYLTKGGARRAVGTFADSVYDGGFDVRVFDGTTWNAQSLASSSGVNEENILAVTNPYDNSEGILAFSDSNSDLWAIKITFDGTQSIPSSSVIDGGTALETTLSHINGLAFDVAFEPPPPATKITQDGYIWENDDALGGVGPGQAQNSGALSPGTVVNDDRGFDAWSFPTRVTTSDDSRSSVTLSNDTEESDYIKATNFGFTIPTNATITGVVVEVESFDTFDENGDNSGRGRLVKNDVVTGNTKTINVSTVEGYETGGSSTDMWGTTLTPADVNSSTFGTVFWARHSHGVVGFKEPSRENWFTKAANAVDSFFFPKAHAVNIGVDVDHIRMTVYYTVPDANATSQQAAGNTAITGVRKGERLNLRTHIKNTGAGYLNDDLALFYDRNDGIWNKVTAPRPSAVGGGNCDSVGTGPDAWECTTASDPGFVAGNALAIDPSGTPWVAQKDLNAQGLAISKYVGSGGNCDNIGTGSDAWDCTIVDNRSDNMATTFDLNFAPDGIPWAVYNNDTTDAVVVAKYVGSGGNCDSVGTGSDAWECTTVDDRTDNLAEFVSLAFAPDGTPWVAYPNNSAASLVVAKYVGSGGNCDSVGTGSDAWECTTVDVRSDAVGGNPSIAFAPDGTPWVAHQNPTADSLITSKYVGSGGNCDSVGTGSDAWECTTVDDRSDEVGSWPSLVFDPSGTPWVAHNNLTTDALVTSRYVGSGGNCDSVGTGSDAWECTTVDDRSDEVGWQPSLGFAPDGTPWIAHTNSTAFALVVSKYVGSKGEITLVPGNGGSNGDSITESHADMTTVPNDANRDDADCRSGSTTWNNGKWFETEDGAGANLNGGVTTAQCTEIAFTIDTSQAAYGQTYRFIIASKDSLQQDLGAWRGPIAVSSNSYSTLTMGTADLSIKRFSKDNSPAFANCTDTTWGCTTTDQDTDNTGQYSSQAFAPDGTQWVAYYDATATALMVAKYVGSEGTGCGASGSTTWTCTQVDNTGTDLGQYTSIGFAPDGTAWVSYYNVTSTSLMVAKYVGSGGVGCTDSAWTCTQVDDTGTSRGQHTSLAVDQSGNPWVSYYDTTSTALNVARYVGTGGTGCSSTQWTCTQLDNTGTDRGQYTSIAIDRNGLPWVSYYDVTSSALTVAQYFGSGGTGCTSTAWTCTTVDNTGTNTGQYTSIAFDPSNNPWVSFYDVTNTALRVATKSGSFGSACTGSGWNCAAVDNNVSATTDTGQYSSIAFDAQGNAWVSYYEHFQTSCNDSPTSECSLKVARFVTSGGNCTSTAWSCGIIDNPTSTNQTGQYTTIAFDLSGSPWVTYYDVTNTALKTAKLHLPMGKPSATMQNVYSGRNATTSDARYHLDVGRSPITDRDGVCSSNGDHEGYCGIFTDDGNYDGIGGTNQRPMFVFAQRGSTNTRLPVIKWIGRSNVAPSSAGTAGDIKLQVYRFGSTNAWEDVTSDTSSSNCNTQNCTLSGMPSGTTSEYYEADGSEYWIYLRVWQYESTGYEFLKTDQFTIIEPNDFMRHGGVFQETLERPFSW